jgi:hypothetical protein
MHVIQEILLKYCNWIYKSRIICVRQFNFLIIFLYHLKFKWRNIYIYNLYKTSCTQFNLNETSYFVLIVFIEELLNIKYWMRKPHTVVHLRSMECPNLVHTKFVVMSLFFFDGQCKNESHRKLQTFELERHICRNHWNAWQQYIFSFEFSI